jgi:hypothetical protein
MVFTVTVTGEPVTVAGQPFPPLKDKLYIVVVVGLTVKSKEALPPVGTTWVWLEELPNKVNVHASTDAVTLPVICVLPPAHIVTSPLVTVTVGVGFTTMLPLIVVAQAGALA